MQYRVNPTYRTQEKAFYSEITQVTFFSASFAGPAVTHNRNELKYAKPAKSNDFFSRKWPKTRPNYGPDGRTHWQTGAGNIWRPPSKGRVQKLAIWQESMTIKLDADWYKVIRQMLAGITMWKITQINPTQEYWPRPLFGPKLALNGPLWGQEIFLASDHQLLLAIIVSYYFTVQNQTNWIN